MIEAAKQKNDAEIQPIGRNKLNIQNLYPNLMHIDAKYINKKSIMDTESRGSDRS